MISRPYVQGGKGKEQRDLRGNQSSGSQMSTDPLWLASGSCWSSTRYPQMNLIDTSLVPSRSRILVLALLPSAIPLFLSLSFLVYKMKGLGVGDHKYHLVLTSYDSGNGIQETEENLMEVV